MKKNKFIIEEATSNQLHAISKLALEVDELHHHFHKDIFKKPSKKTKEEKYWNQFICKKRKKMLVTTYNKEVVAFVNFEIIKEKSVVMHPITYIKIGTICVKHGFRKKGLGTKLMKKINEFANEYKAYEIRLTVWNFNKQAIHLYESLGFKIRSLNLTHKT